MHINTIFQVGPANFKTKQIGYGSVRKGDWPIRWDFLLFTKKVIGSAKIEHYNLSYSLLCKCMHFLLLKFLCSAFATLFLRYNIVQKFGIGKIL